MTTPRSLAFRVGLALSLAACSDGPSTPELVSSPIGPRGGTVALGAEVTLYVPPGALDAEQTITIRRTTESAPAGWSSFSPIYRFEPDGLAFAVPVSVTIAFDGPAPRAVMAWTARAGTIWQPVPGIVNGGQLTAQIDHFSGGFVGSLENDGGVGIDAGAEMDGGSELVDGAADATPGTDADPSGDSGLPAVCPTLQEIPSGATTSSVSWTPTDPSVVDPCFTGCGDATTSRSTALVRIAEPMQVTLWYPHWSDDSSLAHAAIAGDCSAAGASCLTPAPLWYPSILTRSLEPGRYQIVSCRRDVSVVIEPPLPPPPNTTCAGAVPIGTTAGGGYHQGRVTSSGPFYYTLDWSGDTTFPTQLAAASSMNQGTLRLSFRTACDGGELASGTVTGWLLPTGTPLIDMAAHPAGRYYVVATEVLPGQDFSLMMVN